MPSECKEHEESVFGDIRAFVTHSPKKRNAAPQITDGSYKERSSGEFEVSMQDEKLDSLIKEIKDIIKNNS